MAWYENRIFTARNGNNYVPLKSSSLARPDGPRAQAVRQWLDEQGKVITPEEWEKVKAALLQCQAKQQEQGKPGIELMDFREVLGSSDNDSVDVIFHAFDADGNGMIDAEELAIAFSLLTGHDIEEALKTVFASGAGENNRLGVEGVEVMLRRNVEVARRGQITAEHLDALEKKFFQLVGNEDQIDRALLAKVLHAERP